jgi:hypothetical protein
MQKMPRGGHNSENIKLIVESIINGYIFNKSKIHCKLSFSIVRYWFKNTIIYLHFFLAIVCDEGSSLLKLFKQIIFANSENELHYLEDELRSYNNQKIRKNKYSESNFTD